MKTQAFSPGDEFKGMTVVKVTKNGWIHCVTKNGETCRTMPDRTADGEVVKAVRGGDS